MIHRERTERKANRAGIELARRSKSRNKKQDARSKMKEQKAARGREREAMSEKWPQLAHNRSPRVNKAGSSRGSRGASYCVA